MPELARVARPQCDCCVAKYWYILVHHMMCWRFVESRLFLKSRAVAVALPDSIRLPARNCCLEMSALGDENAKVVRIILTCHNQ